MQYPHLLPLLGWVRNNCPAKDTNRKFSEKWYNKAYLGHIRYKVNSKNCQAVKLYKQENKLTLANLINQAFQVAGIAL